MLIKAALLLGLNDIADAMENQLFLYMRSSLFHEKQGNGTFEKLFYLSIIFTIISLQRQDRKEKGDRQETRERAKGRKQIKKTVVKLSSGCLDFRCQCVLLFFIRVFQLLQWFFFALWLVVTNVH
jgi:hypothetical protein